MHLVCVSIGLCEAVASSVAYCASHQVQQYYSEIHKSLSKTSDFDCTSQMTVMNTWDIFGTISLKKFQARTFCFLHQRLLLPTEGTASRTGLLWAWRLRVEQKKIPSMCLTVKQIY